LTHEESLISFDTICTLCPEMFFGISILFLIFHGVLLSYNKNYPLTQKSIIYLSILILFFTQTFTLVADTSVKKEEDIIKKSSSGICHDKNSKFYVQTKKFKAYFKTNGAFFL
jgi:hypothetical protein